MAKQAHITGRSLALMFVVLKLWNILPAIRMSIFLDSSDAEMRTSLFYGSRLARCDASMVGIPTKTLLLPVNAQSFEHLDKMHRKGRELC
ncbi:hypothetical protein AVEN_130411-1 [Araneus ventricosus]|uniref:Uncharacterized protein n=1 Tax=Araneus ventricosus TaxID=182803 RepID=A0A4Y2BDE2_ARAVE|nr:hypothetical protein AVEN_130411-1 [Araneus ventricosus]